MKNKRSVSCLYIFLLSVIALMMAGCQPQVPAVVENPLAPVSAASSTPSLPAPSAIPTTPTIPPPSSTPSPSPTSPPVEGSEAGGMVLVQQINESGYISQRLFYQSPGASPSPLAESLSGMWFSSVSPTGDAILFTAGDLLPHYLKGDYSISPTIATFTMRLDSGLVTNLSDSEYLSLNPDWSPDGQQLVYADWRDQTGNILRVNADGTQLVQLTQDGISYTPRWSPLGDQIAFLRKGSSDRAHIYLMDVNGENVLQITEGEFEDGYMNNLAWSPDGRFLAFVRGEYEPGVDYGPTRTSLLMIDVHSGELVEIDPGPAKLPAWSADGRLAFVRGTYGSPSSSTVLVLENDLYEQFPLAVENVQTRQLAHYPEQQIDQLQWSPDGTLIQYSLKDLDDYHNDAVIILDADTGELVKQMNDYDFIYWLPAPPPAAAAMPDCPAGPSQFEAGQQVALDPGSSSSPLRYLPGTHPLQIGEIGPGEQLTLIQRACAPNRIYWLVESSSDGQRGWMEEGNGQQTWLLP